MTTHRVLSSALSLCWTLALVGCLDSGPAVDRVTAGVGGTVIDTQGRPAAGVAVQLAMLDDAGELSWAGEPTLTDDAGRFAVPTSGPLASGFVLRALLPTGVLRTPALVDAGVLVHPASEALVRVLLEVITAGRSFADLDQTALRELHDLAVAPLPAELDLADATGLAALVRVRVGDVLAAAFLGEIAARPGGALLGPDLVSAGPDFTALPPPEPRATCNRVNYVLAGARFRFDLLANGEICDGNDGNRSDAFDGAFTLRLLGDTFAGGGEYFPAQTQTTLEDERELVFGPVVTSAGLEVTRKVRVEVGDDVVRYLEIVRNPTADAVTLDLEIDGDLGSDDETVLLTTEQGEGRVTPADHFAATVAAAQLDPTVGLVWDGGGRDRADRVELAPELVGGFQYVWAQVTIPPQGLAVYAHFAWLTVHRDQQGVARKLGELLARPPLGGLSADELRALANFPTTVLANVAGGAGAMPPAGMLTVHNLVTAAEVATVARPDGGFAALLLDAASGQELVVRSLGGFERRVFVGE